MILERLTVAGFRTFAQPLEFTPDPRFTVIAAPNGTGKSTLLDALYFGLLERHSVTGAGAEQRFKSIGREITPSIDIDFRVDATSYRLRKKFLNGARSASLQRLESGRYVPFKDGVAADDFVRTLFCAEPSGRGALEPSRNLGLHHVLWSPARASFTRLPDNAGDAIRSMLGGSALAVTPGERAVAERVAAEYARFFTDEGSFTARAGSANIPAIEARLRSARTAEVEAREHYARLDRLNVESADRNAEADRMSAARNRLRAEIVTVKAQVTAFNELRAAADRACSTEREARLRYQQCSERNRELAAALAEQADLAREHAACASDLDALQIAAAGIDELVRSARQIAENAAANLADVHARAAGVTAARTYLDSLDSIDTLQSTIDAADRAATAFVEFSTAEAALVAPSRDELEALRTNAAEIDALEAAIAASALSLDIEPERDVTIEVVAARTTGPATLLGGSSSTFVATDASIVIDIPGFGRVRAHATDGAAKARKKREALLASREAADLRFGTSVIAELAERRERADRLRRAADEAQAQLDAACDGRSPAAVREALVHARLRIASIETAYPAWRTERPLAHALRAAFDRDLEAATDAARLAQIEFQAATSRKSELDAAFGELRTRETGIAIKRAANVARQSSLTVDGLDAGARTEQERELALTWGAVTAVNADTHARLAAIGEDPNTRLVRLEAAELEAGTAFERALGDAKTCFAQLDIQANLGSYAKLASAEEHVAACESELAAVVRQAGAVEHLYHAFEKVRAERVAAVLEPITMASTRYLTRIAGSPMGEIEIGEGFTPDGLIHAASRMRIAIDGTLSTGEKEQIFLATRLALAEIISEGRGRQLFVVDDALTATDPNRLRRFIAILEELSRERLQIIVTTADRSRYLGISGAKHVDLAAARLDESAA